MKLITSILLIQSLFALVKTESIELKPDNFKQLTRSGTWLIEHFSPYCPHCKNFAPEWKKLSEDLESLQEKGFYFGTIDCSTQGDLCDEHNILRYPTLQLWKQGEKVEDYHGFNKYDPLMEYILEKVPTETESALPEQEESSQEEEEEESNIEFGEEEEDNEPSSIDFDEEDSEASTADLDEEDESEQEVANDNEVVEDEEEEEEPLIVDLAEEEENTADETSQDESEQTGDFEVEVLGPEVYDEMPEEEDTTEAVEQLPNPSGTSINLGGDQMRVISKGDTPWFVKFYAPWCPHCQRLAPTWKEMAHDLTNQVNVGEVNCEVLKHVCQEYNIKGFPTLQMFGFGKPIDYFGDRSLASLLKFAHKHSGPIVKDINNDKLSQELANGNTVFLYLHNGQDTVPEIVEQVANEFSNDMAFYVSQDKQLISKLKFTSMDLPAILVYKDGQYHIYPSQDFTQQVELTNWIELLFKTNTSQEAAVVKPETSYNHWFLLICVSSLCGFLYYKKQKKPYSVLPSHHKD